MESALTIVVPCFNEEAALPAFFKEAIEPIDAATGGNWQIICVDDGSDDATALIILEQNRRDRRVTGLRLSRNWGHQAALNCGLAYASGQHVAIVDCDLQDPISILIELYHKCIVDGNDIAFGVRRKRAGLFFRRICYRIFYRLMQALSDHAWPMDAGDFCVFNAKVHRLLLAMPENVRVLRGLRSWVGLKQAGISYARPDRQHGRTKYSLTKLWRLATSSLVNFSTAPLRLAVWIGLIMAVACFVLSLLLLLNRLFPRVSVFGYYIGANPGIATLGILLCFIGSMGFLCLGILGEYLALIVEETKRRPAAIIQERFGNLERQETGFRISEIE
jgi:glycosyltransferase involved in cell wall biosynthesis